ncbi:MAG: 2-polyprenyl-3-methyl-5-hydroxy-6-metoxy-1,4-benzoquinol methylase [Saprospiraceae bacterium]|jgi:2-polyprenyl-3-methyl-5-hydroxy-6-metoxy-1,4-benzoquinol methylase
MKTIHIDKCPICSSTKLFPHMKVTDIPYSGETYEVEVCQNCSFALTQDAPSEEEMGKYYNFDNYMSHADAAESVVDKLYHKVRDWMFVRKEKWIKAHITGRQLLDLGAGTGYFVNYMQIQDYKITGVEPEPGARKTAAEKLGIELHSMEAMRNFEEGSFDGITMWHVLEHIHEIDAYFETINKVLKKDGALFIAVPNYTSAAKKAFEEYWNGWDVPKHLWHFSPSSMETLANKKGYDLEAKYQLPFDPFYISMLSQRNKSVNFWQIRGLFRGFGAYLKERSNVDKACSILYVLKRRSS